MAKEAASKKVPAGRAARSVKMPRVIPGVLEAMGGAIQLNRGDGTLALIATSGACTKGADPRLFVDDDESPSPDGGQAAKAICGTCIMQKKCLAYALKNEEWGVWGGTTYTERRAIRGSVDGDAEEVAAFLEAVDLLRSDRTYKAIGAHYGVGERTVNRFCKDFAEAYGYDLRPARLKNAAA